ncbi:MAG: hypothetical protein UY50_C0006G0043 [Parcubacteria group bacterium GW2011_GWA2_49_9]|nr:MAG: hypothetical protein UY50_C0006G0043 [Parcubacteria group bacterium GW2011_GWA2_49_9]
MIGLLLTFAATFFTEAQESLGKQKVAEGKQSIYTMGFLSMLWSTVFFLCIIITKHTFVFSLASLPTFITRVVLELILAQVSVIAITRADRSTYNFIRVGTIPLLLITDLILGYSITLPALFGIGIIILALLILFRNHGVGKKGVLPVIATTLLAVATLSLYKYNITHFNSVEAEEGIVGAILVLYFFCMAVFVAKENPLRSLLRPDFFVQSLSAGLGNVLMGFAYLYGAASIITTAKRGLSVLWAILSGKMYFREKGLYVKLLALAVIVIGLALTIL